MERPLKLKLRMEGLRMKKWLLALVAMALAPVAVSAQQKPVIVVQVFTAASDVVWPYDMKLMQAQTVAEFKVALGKDFDIVADAPTLPQGKVYTLDVEVAAWRGNDVKRLLVGRWGSGREAADISYRVTDESGKKVLERKETIRTNFVSQGAGSTERIAHPFAEAFAERIKAVKLK
jgi:hypothetical protein